MTIVINGTGTISGISATDGLSSPQTGSVLQVIETVKTNSFSTSSTSFIDVTGLSVSITPKFSTSRILVFVSLMTSNSVNSRFNMFNLVRNSTNLLQPASSQSGSSSRTSYLAAEQSAMTVAFQYTDSPATTSATTYKIQTATNSGGTCYVGNRGVNDYEECSVITVMEIAG